MNTGTARRPRAYRQTARAEAAAETHRSIAEAFLALLRERWFEDVTLDEVAAGAGVTAQTVIRRYGGKDGLLEDLGRSLSRDFGERRATPAGDVRGAIRSLVEDYEAYGDLFIRLLAQEERQPALRSILALGRREHAEWVATVFAESLRSLPPTARRRRLDALVAVTDVYTWRILRRDKGNSATVVAELIHETATALADKPGGRK